MEIAATYERATNFKSKGKTVLVSSECVFYQLLVEEDHGFVGKN